MDQTQPQRTAADVRAKAGLSPHGSLTPTEDAVDYLKAYARQNPEKAALWCLGVGFVLGWKLKPW